MEMVAKGYKATFFYLAILFVLAVSSKTVFSASGGKQHGGKIARAQFATSMDQREPVDDVIFVDDKETEVYFFTEVLYMTGHKVVHRWEHDGKEVSRVSFDIGGPRWRVFSRKKLDETIKGKWTVLVTDEDGWPLASKIFVFGAEHKNKHLDDLMLGQPQQPLQAKDSKDEASEILEKKQEQGENPEDVEKPIE